MFLTNFYFKGKCKKLIEPDREEDKTTEDDEAEEEEEEHKEAAAAGTAASKQPAKIEEILPELTEREETIKGYLEKDETLPSEILDEVIMQLWNEEPFKSRGFILDGFPNNESQAQYLIEKGFIPDAFIILRIEEDDVIKRVLPPRLKAWQEKMKVKKEKKKARAQRKREKLVRLF
jgi:adenylate/nucleoside-diphosphate kinase